MTEKRVREIARRSRFNAAKADSILSICFPFEDVSTFTARVMERDWIEQFSVTDVNRYPSYTSNINTCYGHDKNNISANMLNEDILIDMLYTYTYVFFLGNK